MLAAAPSGLLLRNTRACCSPRRYVMGSVLGAGSFGVVRECTDRRSGRRFAVKSINKVWPRATAYVQRPGGGGCT